MMMIISCLPRNISNSSLRESDQGQTIFGHDKGSPFSQSISEIRPSISLLFDSPLSICIL